MVSINSHKKVLLTFIFHPFSAVQNLFGGFFFSLHTNPAQYGPVTGSNIWPYHCQLYLTIFNSASRPRLSAHRAPLANCSHFLPFLLPRSPVSLKREYILLCILICNTHTHTHSLCSAWIIMLNKMGQIAQEMVRVTDFPSLPFFFPRSYQLRWLHIVSVRVVMFLITSSSPVEKSVGCRIIK